MKITNISIENLGPYIGKNVLTFDISNSSRNVILIGGKNGAGKTTLFNSIKIGLYGCRAYGFESENAKYLDVISNLINSKAKLERAGVARIIISVLMEDGKDDFHYRFERTWKLSTKQLREDLRIYRNDIILNETEKSDFQSYLMQLIPPDMFRFYFFDGESISSFIFNGIRNTDFRNAFLKLCGLDTMDIIHENLLRLSNAKKKDLTGAFEIYQAVAAEHNAAQQELSNAKSEKDAIQDKIIEIDEELAQNENSYVLRGGITKKEYNAMQTQISREEARRDTTRKWLRDVANDIIPFIILRDQLIQLRTQIVEECQQQTVQAFCAALNSPSMHRKLYSLFLDAVYDLFQHTYLDAEICGRRNSDERGTLCKMVDRSNVANALIIADRGYESYNLMAHIQEKSWKYLIRIKDIHSSGIASGLELPNTDEFDVHCPIQLTRRRKTETIPLLANKNNYKWIATSTPFDYLSIGSHKHDAIVLYHLPFRIVRFRLAHCY